MKNKEKKIMIKDAATQAAYDLKELSVLKIQIDNYKKDLEVMSKEKKDLQHKLERMAKEKEVDTKKILDLTNEITAINFASSAKDVEVKELRAYVETLENKIVEKDNFIKNQDDKINKLEAAVAELYERYYYELNNKKNAWAQTADLKAENESLKEVIAKIEKRNIWERIINVKIK